MMQNLNKNKILSFIKVAWVVAVVAGGIYYVVKNYASALKYLHTISTARLFLAFFLIVAVRVLNVDLVQRSLMLIGWKPDFKRAFAFVSLSQLGKYIPGGVWQFVARFGAYKENQISYKNMGKAFIVENIWMVFGLFFVSLFFIFLSGPIAILEQYHISLSAGVQKMLALACLILWVLTLVIVERVMIKKVEWKSISLQFLSQTSMWILSGVSFYCLFNQAFSVNSLFYAIGAFGLSFLAGYVVIIAPGGIGVREAVAILLFSLTFSSAEIGVYTIVHRLLYTLAEFLIAGIALLMEKKWKTSKFTGETEAPLEIIHHKGEKNH